MLQVYKLLSEESKIEQELRRQASRNPELVLGERRFANHYESLLGDQMSAAFGRARSAFLRELYETQDFVRGREEIRYYPFSEAASISGSRFPSFKFRNPFKQYRVYDKQDKGSEIVVRDLRTGREFSSKKVNVALLGFMEKGSAGEHSYIQAKDPNQVMALLCQIQKPEMGVVQFKEVLPPVFTDVEGEMVVFEHLVFPFKAVISYSLSHLLEVWRKILFGSRQIKGIDVGFYVDVIVQGGVTCEGMYGHIVDTEVTNASVAGWKYQYKWL